MGIKWVAKTVYDERVPFVLASWGAQVRKWGVFSRFDKDEFEYHCERIFKPTLCQAGVTLAVDPNADDHVYGWICGEHKENLQVLYFVYVRSLFRQQGIATQLLENIFSDFKKKPLHYTYETRSWRHYRDKWKAKYNPYLIGE